MMQLNIKISEARKGRLLRLLADRIWPLVRAGRLGRRMIKKEREKLLGYGPEGV